jgi:hypothetical protein
MKRIPLALAAVVLAVALGGCAFLVQLGGSAAATGDDYATFDPLLLVADWSSDPI